MYFPIAESVLCLGIGILGIGFYDKYQLLKIPHIGWIFYAMFGGVPEVINRGVIKDGFNEIVNDGDVFISGGLKSGTHWVMEIVNQIRAKGQASLYKHNDLYSVVPWLEFKHGHYQNVRDRIESLKTEKKWQNPKFVFRAFKTHLIPKTNVSKHKDSILPVKERPCVRYIAVIRNGKEVMESAYDHILSFSDKYRKYYGGFPMIVSYEKHLDISISDREGSLLKTHAIHAKEWLKVKQEPNVLVLHYSNLRKNPLLEMKKIANFLQINVPQNEWPGILERTSKDYMIKNHKWYLMPYNNEIPYVMKKIVMKREKIDFPKHYEKKYDDIMKSIFPNEKEHDWKEGNF